MLNKDEIKVGDLVVYGNNILQVKKVNKESIATKYGINIKFNNVVFKIDNEEAKKIYLDKLSRQTKYLVSRLANLRDIVLEVDNMNDHIKFDIAEIKKEINNLIEKIKEVLEDA